MLTCQTPQAPLWYTSIQSCKYVKCDYVHESASEQLAGVADHTAG